MDTLALRASATTVFALALLLAGCAAAPSRPPPPPPPELERAEQLIALGQFRRAANLFLDLAARQPERADHWRLRAAEALREEGELDTMRAVLDDLRSSQLDRGQLLRLDLLLAESELAQGRPGQALDLLTWRIDDVALELRARFLELRARALFELGRYEASARERLVLGELLSGGERDANALEIIDTLSLLSMDELRRLIAASGPQDPLRASLLAAASRVPVDSRPLPAPEPVEIEALDEDETAFPAMPEGLWQLDGYLPPRRVAVLLPQTGPLRAAAAAVRDGILAAYFADRGERPLLEFIDSGEDAIGALIAYERAVASGADRIVGPLSREAVTALLGSGRMVRPTLLLNHGDGGLSPPAGSLQFGLPPEEEGQLVADRLLALRRPRAIIVRFDGEAEQRLATAFTQRLLQRGGQVLGDLRLNRPEDLQAELPPLLGIGESRARHRQVAAIAGLSLGFEPSRRADLDAVFLIARPAEARRLMPELRSLGLADLALVAASRSHALEPAPQDRDLDGLQFPDQPWLFGEIPGLPPRAELATALPSAGPATARLFALGFDAYRLLPYLDWLTLHPHVAFPGASGYLRVDPRGLISRELPWARYAGGQARLIGGEARR